MPSAPARAVEPRLRRLEYFVVLSAVAFAVIVAIVSAVVGVGPIMERLARVGNGAIVVLLTLSLCNYVARTARWLWFSRALGIAAPWPRNALYFIAGLAMTTTPAKAGEALRLWLIERCHRYPYQRIAPLFIADRLNDVVAVLLLCIAGVGAFTGYAGLILIAAGGFVLVILPFVRPRVLTWLVNRLYGVAGRRWPRLFAKLRTALRDTARLFTFRVFGVGLALGLFGWFCESFALAVLLDALGAPITVQAAVFVFTFSMIGGAVSMLPGGLGGTEIAMVGLLRVLGVDLDTAIAATAIIRLTTLWFACALGFVALPIALRLARRGPAVLRPARA